MNESNQKILVAYKDKYGYISEIVDNMSRKFRELGLKVEIVDLERTKERRWPTINDYTGVY